MAKRSDGIRTRNRILKVASEVFAQKGYHEATVEEICRHAKTNVAAISYHFGSKDRLYAQIWREAFEAAMAAYPPEGGCGPEAPVEQRLRGSIYGMIGIRLFTGHLPAEAKLDMPTDKLIETLADHITRFSLAGVGAIRQDLEAGRTRGGS